MKKAIGTLAVLGIFAPAALAASHFVKVAPSSVKAGKTVRVYGSAAPCVRSNTVILTSKAFKGATTHEFAGVPAVYAKQDKHHNFSAKVTLKKSTKKGKYNVGGRCGGGNFGGTTLKVT